MSRPASPVREETNVTRPDINAMFTLKVDNISFETTKEILDEEFCKFGKIGDIYIPRATQGRRGNRGYAFVRFIERDRMEDAQRALDGKLIDGKEIKILEAKEKRPENPRQHMLDKGYGAFRHNNNNYNNNNNNNNNNNRRRSRSRSLDRREYRGDYDDRRRHRRDDRRDSRDRDRRNNSRDRDPRDTNRDRDRRDTSRDFDRRDRRSKDRSRD